MDQTFISIHDLSADATVLYASDSITDILGYEPDEILGKSYLDYFHHEDAPLARSVHGDGVVLDKAAVLHYVRIKSRDGSWISCECCFSVVHDVLMASTSVYRLGADSEQRAVQAQRIQRIFSAPPRDPRYHMLEHLTPRFSMPAVTHEPRAALILNRFTRSLTILHSTSASRSILGLEPDEILDRSFYDFIQEHCLQDAIECLDSAKQNESIAYLRFWLKDLRHLQRPSHAQPDDALPTPDGTQNGAQTDDNTVHHDIDNERINTDEVVPPNTQEPERGETGNTLDGLANGGDNASEANNDRALIGPSDAVPGASVTTASSSNKRKRDEGSEPRRLLASIPRAETAISEREAAQGKASSAAPTELEAVVSCTSDGLVVVLRKARETETPDLSAFINMDAGIFAAPWANPPVQPEERPVLSQPLVKTEQEENFKTSSDLHTRPSAGGPSMEQLMKSIREVAVFAWALTGINGNLASHGNGIPRAGAQPSDGLPIWDPSAEETNDPATST